MKTYKTARFALFLALALPAFALCQGAPILKEIRFSATGMEIRADVDATGEIQGVRAEKSEGAGNKLVVDFPGTRSALRPLYKFEDGSSMKLLNVLPGDPEAEHPTPTRLIFQLNRPFDHDLVPRPGGYRILFRIRAGSEPPVTSTRAVPVEGGGAPPARETLDLDRLRGEVAPEKPASASSRPPAARPAAPPAPPTGGLRTVPTVAEGEYRVGPGDVLKVVVHGDESMSREALTVSPDGLIDLPNVKAFKATGKTPSQIEKDLEEYLGRTILVEPDVTVSVVEHHSQIVTIIGEVKHPQRLALRGPTRLMEVLSESEGLTEDAGETIRIMRSRKNEVLTISVDDLKHGSQEKFAAANVLLEAGDIINVPKRGVFYIAGEVKQPGQYKLERNLMITQAISLAGGFTEWARRDNVYVIRKDGQKVQANIKKILSNRSPNLVIEADDQIQVPTKFAGK